MEVNDSIQCDVLDVVTGVDWLSRSPDYNCPQDNGSSVHVLIIERLQPRIRQAERNPLDWGLHIRVFQSACVGKQRAPESTRENKKLNMRPSNSCKARGQAERLL